MEETNDTKNSQQLSSSDTSSAGKRRKKKKNQTTNKDPDDSTLNPNTNNNKSKNSGSTRRNHQGRGGGRSGRGHGRTDGNRTNGQDQGRSSHVTNSGGKVNSNTLGDKSKKSRAHPQRKSRKGGATMTEEYTASENFQPQPHEQTQEQLNLNENQKKQQRKRNERQRQKQKDKRKNDDDKNTTKEKQQGTNGTSNSKSKAENTKSTYESSQKPSSTSTRTQKTRRNENTRSSRAKKIMYPDYTSLPECHDRYYQTTSTNTTANTKPVIQGKLRVLKGGKIAFLACDRGIFQKDIVLDGEIARNRALDGDMVFVEIVGTTTNANGTKNGNGDEKHAKSTKINIISRNDDDEMEDCDQEDATIKNDQTASLKDDMQKLQLEECTTNDNGIDGKVKDDIITNEEEIVYEDYEIDESEYNEEADSCNGQDDNDNEEFERDCETWHDDKLQKSLWDPIVNIRRKRTNENDNEAKGNDNDDEEQYMGRVIHIIPPKALSSEFNPAAASKNTKKSSSPRARRTIVGTLMKMPGANHHMYLLNPSNRSLPRFMTPSSTKTLLMQNSKTDGEEDGDNSEDQESLLYSAEYVYGSWLPTNKWAPCVNLKPLGRSCNVEDETMALLMENGVNHGEFEPKVLKNVERVVESGRIQTEQGGERGWEPTKEMYKGRRDYRKERIFTIDPTTAKDLDDALHIKELPDGRVEIGVHIADVSYFVTPDSDVDQEAARRTTTVYLVDRVIPMLPRPLCEIACSLNENVERLAFSCVWTMNKDGTLYKTKESKKGKKRDDVWYGRTVIKSCSRLDYATAQNIIDGKVANGEKVEDVDETFWPKSRQPTGGHSIDDVANDVRLMHTVAMARRKLRFENGALALNGVKLTFQLEDDGETPALCAPYPIRDSNRLIEEYMLLANYLVAQRLITHAGSLAVLRKHMPPLQKGLQSVVDVAQESIGFHIDGSSSESLQSSLSQLGRECTDDLVMQVVTEMLMTPMRPAEYIAAGTFEAEQWCHFALNIPYYTHFTSPIRRYPDVLVHRLLQATIDGKEAVENFELSEAELQALSDHCNEKRMASKKAQDRSDRVFLSLFLKTNPIPSVLAIVVSVGEKAFTVFVPSLGLSTMVFLDDHKDRYDTSVHKHPENGKNRMIMVPKGRNGMGRNDNNNNNLDIRIMTKIAVSCHCKEKPPIDVKLEVMGEWRA